MVVGILVGPAVLGWYDTRVESDSAETLASLALATVLFGDATTVRLKRLRANSGEPIRLLTIGLLGSVALGGLLANMMFGTIGIAVALVIGVMLAPTDAALGAPVVENPAIPARVRQSLFVESGLNDGIAVPLLLIALAFANIQELGDAGIAEILFMKIVVSAAVGVGIATAAHYGLRLASRHGGHDAVWTSLIPLLTAVFSYALTEYVGGSGFIAAFVGGITFGSIARSMSTDGVKVDTAVSSLLQGTTWFLFGALVAGPVLLTGHLQWSWVAYAVLSLTVVRVLPVSLALLGTGQRWQTIVFMGWFGPRGLASIVFLLIVIGLKPLASDAIVIGGTVTVTVLLSVVLHGLTATPLARRYGAWASTTGVR